MQNLDKITIATRGSKLALWQAEHIKSRLLEVYPTLTVEFLILKTQGDVILDVPLSMVGGKGLFVKEIEEALLDGRADIAVHSMKDVPMQLPEGLCIDIVPKREVANDVFVSIYYTGLSSLSSGAIVGTSSLRRKSQILAIRPDVEVTTLRGNIDTRLRKLQEGQYDAIVLAEAGLKRLDLSMPYIEKLCPQHFMPAAGQGALGIEFRVDRQDIANMLSFLNDDATKLCVFAERSFLRALNGSCQVPIGAYATIENEQVVLKTLIGKTDGTKIVKVDGTSEELSIESAVKLGENLASEALEQGGRSVLNSALYAD